MPEDTLSTPGLSQIERVVDTFVAPSKTFTDIRTNASWWMPFLLMLIFSLASGYVVDRQIGFDRVYATSVSHMAPFIQDQMNKLSPEQKAAATERGIVQTKVTAYGLPVILLIMFAIYALVLWASFNFGLGAKTTYSQVLAVSWYAALPYLIRSILTIVTVAAGVNTDSFELRNPVGTNLAYYLPEAAGWLKGMLLSFDIVALWSLALTVIGMSIISGKSKMQSFIIVIIFFIIGVLFSTVGGAISG